MHKHWITRLPFLFIVLMICLSLHYLSLRHYQRMDLTTSELFTLSDKSRAIVQGLAEPVSIYAYFNPNHELAKMLKNLLKAYQSSSENVHVHWVDPYRDFEKMQELGDVAAELKRNTVLVSGFDRKKILTPFDLGIYDRKLEQFGLDPKLLQWNGETAISGSILSLADSKPPIVGLITSHAERNPNDTSEEGLSNIVEHLQLQGIQFTLVPLHQMQTIPDSIQVLASHQPKIPFTDHEMILLADWITRGGALFIAMDPLIKKGTTDMLEYGLDLLLKPRGLAVENTIVVDPAKQIPYSRPDHLYVDLYSDFEAVKNMPGLPTLYFQARSIKIESTDDWNAYPLCLTSKSGWGEVNYSDPNYNFDPTTDKPGPTPIAAAAVHKSGKGKIILVGDSDFMTNRQIKNGGNLKLIENCFFWLLEKTAFLELPPKDAKMVSLKLTRQDLLMILFLGVGLFPFMAVLLGVGVSRFRR